MEGPVHTAKLRVDQQAGAGLQLSACEAVQNIETISDWLAQLLLMYTNSGSHCFH